MLDERGGRGVSQPRGGGTGGPLNLGGGLPSVLVAGGKEEAGIGVITPPKTSTAPLTSMTAPPPAPPRPDRQHPPPLHLLQQQGKTVDCVDGGWVLVAQGVPTYGQGLLVEGLRTHVVMNSGVQACSRHSKAMHGGGGVNMGSWVAG